MQHPGAPVPAQRASSPAQTVSPASPPALATGGAASEGGGGRRVAFGGWLWDEMTPEEQDAALLLGYVRASWDGGEVPDACTHPWLLLSTIEQNAATRLGYTKQTWDAEVPSVGGDATKGAPSAGRAYEAPPPEDDGWMEVGASRGRRSGR